MRFTLTIELGNDAMQSREDVKGAIHNALTRQSDYESMTAPLERDDQALIRDGNGNTVGAWSVT